MKKSTYIKMLGLAVLFASGAAQAGTYICTGASGSADNSDPYFNGDLTDPLCDESEINTALGIVLDNSLIVGSKTNSTDGGPDGDLDGWLQDEWGLGTLTVSTYGNTTGTWELVGTIAPLFAVIKYDSGYDVFGYAGTGIGTVGDPFTDSWVDDYRGLIGAACNDNGGSINCKANVSHLSVYGEVPIPTAAWLFGSGLIGLAGIVRKRRAS